MNNYNETVLILDRDREAATSTASRLAREGRLILTGSDAAVGSLVLARMPVSSLHTDAQLDGPFSVAVLDLVADARRRAAACDIVVSSREELAPSWCAEATRRGATQIVRRPVERRSARRRTKGTLLHIPTIDELIASAHLLPAFQPIVDVGGDNPSGHGYESLARFDDGALSFCDPQFLFDYARLTGRTAELELACLRRTLRQARSLPSGAKLFINLHPHVLDEGERLTRTLVQEAGDNGVALRNVVLEITEQEKLAATAPVCAAFESLRAHGVQFALDDVGNGYSHLDRIECVKPAYLKVSHEFGTDFEKNPVRRKIIGNILSLAHDFDCEVVLEGIESAETSGAAHDIGARYAQGFFYARPQQAAAFESAEA
ncbi:MAG TPA: EAL domain-containing protein [Thermoanaerobaculia bacterium]|jgi:EAL domain-containing protein (putative c-di-GMP-specific phosphodiesterase class I)